jgi:hypothetical protein
MKNRFGCFATLIVLGFAAYGAYYATHPARVGGVAFQELPPETQKTRRVEAQKLVKQVEAVARAARKDEKTSFTLTATEEQLNTLLQDRLKTEKFPIHDLRAGLSPGQMTLQGNVNYQGFDAPATMNGSLSVQNGALEFQVDSLQIAGLPAPGEWKEKAQKGIDGSLKKAFGADRNARIESVKIEEGLMTVKGQTG